MRTSTTLSPATFHGEGALDRVQLHAEAGATAYELSGLAGVDQHVQRALAVAAASGAGAVAAVAAARDAADTRRDQERAVRVAAAQTRAVAAVLTLAPLTLSPVISALFGVDAFAFYRQRPGSVVLIGALALTATGLAIIRWLVRRIRSHADDEVADLVATAMASGCTAATALRVVADSMPRHATALRASALGLQFGLRPTDNWDEDSGTVSRITTALVAAETLGAPVIDVLRRLARQLRAEQLASVKAAAERLPAQLTFPTTLVLLPAGLMVVAAPVVAEVFTGLTAISPQ
ncbi:MAG: type II secretion system F family protein [Nitriliruptoraceae bacterium]